MAKTNRFYRPSASQYTSQFIQDRFPYEQLIDFEKTETQRAEVMASRVGAAEAENSLLTAGYDTQDIVGPVKDYWDKQWNSYIDKYGNRSDMQAMRAFSSVRSGMLNDPNVQRIKESYRRNPGYEAIQRSKRHPKDINPNIDPETGRVRQLGFATAVPGYEGDIEIGGEAKPYQSMKGYINPEEILYKALKDIETKVTEEGTSVTFPDSGLTYDAWRSTTKVTDEKKNNAFNRLMQESMNPNTELGFSVANWKPELLNEDGSVNVERTAQWIMSSYDLVGPKEGTSTHLVGEGRGSLYDPDAVEDVTLELGVQRKPESYGDYESSSASGPLENNARKTYKRALKMFAEDDASGEIKWLGDVNAYLNDDQKLAYAVGQDYDIVVDQIKDYFDNIADTENYSLEGASASVARWGALRKAKRYDKVINKTLTDDEKNIASKFDYSQKELKTIDPKELKEIRNRIKEERVTWLERGAKIAYQKFGFHDKSEEEMTDAFIGKMTDAQGKVTVDGAGGAILNHYMVGLDNKGNTITVTERDRRNLIGKDMYASAEGTLDEEQPNYWGPGMMYLNIDGDKYLMRGSKEYFDRNHLTYMLNDWIRHYKNKGRPFGIRFDRNTRSSDPFYVISEYNKNDVEADGARWFSVNQDNSARDLIGTKIGEWDLVEYRDNPDDLGPANEWVEDQDYWIIGTKDQPFTDSDFADVLKINKDMRESVVNWEKEK